MLPDGAGKKTAKQKGFQTMSRKDTLPLKFNANRALKLHIVSQEKRNMYFTNGFFLQNFKELFEGKCLGGKKSKVEMFCEK